MIYVWDLPTRVSHWLLVVLVSAAVFTGLSGGNWMFWHGRLGVAILGLLTFRLLWGVLGSTYARFRQFVPTLTTLRAYLRGNWHGVGHNPLGALSVLALLTVLLCQAVTGLFADDDIAFQGALAAVVSGEMSQWFTGLHRQWFWLVVGVVALHLSAVLFYSLIRGETLIRAMLTGNKTVTDPTATAASGGGWLALVVALAGAAMVMWLADGGLVPVAAPVPASAVPSW
ncbi:cytochrome B [Chromatium okenii]|uniref:cytochrome b/b6 domain-containing protein n=1 Tax=Chromatium okenii TaxID=61644 RepID=UPI001905D5B3|nr:cytochrome B [Chromatium okenii]